MAEHFYGKLPDWNSMIWDISGKTDQMLQVLWANYRIWEPKSFYRSINMNSNQYAGWDFSGNHLFDGLNANAFI